MESSLVRSDAILFAPDHTDAAYVGTGNPKLLNPKLPRSELQTIYVDDILDSTQTLEEKKHLREDPGNCVAVSKMIQQLDWRAIGALLEK